MKQSCIPLQLKLYMVVIFILLSTRQHKAKIDTYIISMSLYNIITHICAQCIHNLAFVYTLLVGLGFYGFRELWQKFREMKYFRIIAILHLQKNVRLTTGLLVFVCIFCF